MAGYFLVTFPLLLLYTVPSLAQDVVRELSYSTEEELVGSRNLGNIYIDANLTDILGTTQDVSFSIISGQFSSYFNITENGDFFVISKIDREQDCAKLVTCIYPVKVWAIRGANLVQIDVSVEIMDVNDNSPKFTRSSENLSIPEQTPTGTTYELPIATDLDSPANGVVQYTMASFDIDTDDNFSLQVRNKSDGTQVLNLVLHLTLDREAKASYLLFIRALDYGNKSDQLTVNITVLDVNDNIPKFAEGEYNISMDEDVEVGTTIVIVTATDRDSGDNARLSYSINSYNPTSISNSIAINETTGAIYVKAKIDSTHDAYTLYVEARDHGNPPKKSDLKVVTINVKDKNDNPPVIQVTLVKNGMVAENSDIGTPVAHIRVDDADKGINKEANCTLDNVNFTINKLDQMNFFKVDVNQNFDREILDEYTVTVNCTDKGTPPLSSSKSFKVTITDVNDNNPEFDTSYYEKSINENNQPGAVLFRLYASDKDKGQNADLTFEILPFPEDSKFRIESKTGIIKAVRGFDRETDNATYTFRVMVKDNGNPQLNDTTVVRLIIMDINDNSPKFDGDSYSMSVFENTDTGESIGQIVARDPDEGDNGKVSFMIPKNYSSFPFRILDDGTMLTTEVLDHENRSQYVLNVVAYDHGNPPLQNHIQVSVIVKDLNDNPPIIDFPGDENYTVDVPNSASINETLTTILAHDADAKNNKRLSYSIVSGNDEEMFWINENSGEIHLKKKVGDVMHYILTISARDNGENNQFETSATLHIKFFVANDAGGASETAAAGSKNILIAVVISCVTFVLSVALICVIGMICRKDRKRRLYSHKQNDQQKIMDSNHRNSNRSSSSKGSQDKMLFPEHSYSDGFYQPKKKGKEVSFSFDDEQDTGISMSTNGQFDPVSTFKSPSPEPSIQSDNMYKQQQPSRVETPPPKPERSEDKKQREIYRMTSLKVHQALIKNNNNNNSKPWPQPANDETTKQYIGLTTRNHLDDCHSETSGETTTSDSGRGGSEEDIRSNMTGSHETDDSRSPNTSTSHPFYTAESHQPTFTSFRGNSVHRNGPILSSFLNKGHNYKNSHENSYPNSFPLNDLSSPSVKSANDIHNHKHSDINLPNINESATFTPGFGLGLGKINNDPLLHGSHPSNLDIHNSLENGSITARSQDDDNTTTTSGSYTINDLHDDLMSVQGGAMFYKPDTFV